MTEQKSKRNTKLDRAQLRALEKIQHRERTGQLAKWVAHRLRRLRRKRPKKAAAWENTFGISHPEVRPRVAEIRRRFEKAS